VLVLYRDAWPRSEADCQSLRCGGLPVRCSTAAAKVVSLVACLWARLAGIFATFFGWTVWILVPSVDRSIVTGMARSRGSFLLVVSDRQALGWILREQRTAFPPGRSRLPRALEPDDRLVLYTTRGCFRNPSQDRGRVIATAVVSTPVRDLREAVVFGDRAFTSGCDLVINGLAPWRQGPEIGLLVPRLRTFPAAWAIHLRAALVRLDDHDYGVLERELSQVVIAREAALPAYLEHAMPVRRRSVPRGTQHAEAGR